MELLTNVAEHALVFFGVSGTYEVFGNSMSEYALASTIFLLGLLVFSLMQYVLLAWFTVLSKRTKTDIDDALVKMVRSFKPPFYLFLSFWFALLYVEVAGIAQSFVTAVLVLWFIYQAVVVVGILIEDVVFVHLMNDRDETTKSAFHVLATLVKGVMWVLGIFLVLSNFGIDITSLMAGAGIAGLAIAFALQGILSDLFSSFSLYFDKPFKVGDAIVVQDTRGVVKRIGIKTTRIQALTGEEVILSNQDLTSSKIQNFGRMDERRAVFSFGILYETEAKKVAAIPNLVRDIILAQDKVRFDRAHFKSFGDSSLDFEVVYYVLDSDYTLYMDIQEKINLALLTGFEKEGIGFAYPTRMVHIASSK